jgi:hypothetical protein
MLGYMERTKRDGDLPLYNPAVYAEALELGYVPSQSSRSKK